MIPALVVTALVVARLLTGCWRAMTWVFLAVNALFVLWIAQIIIELPRGCAGSVATINEDGSETPGPWRTLPASEGPASYRNDEGAQVGHAVTLWSPVFVALGLIWLTTRPKSVTASPHNPRDIEISSSVSHARAVTCGSRPDDDRPARMLVRPAGGAPRAGVAGAIVLGVACAVSLVLLWALGER